MEEKELPEEELMMEPSSTDFNMGVNMVHKLILNYISIGPKSNHCIGYPCQYLPNSMLFSPFFGVLLQGQIMRWCLKIDKYQAYMQKTCDVAEKAILAKKNLRKKCVNRDKM